MFLVNLITTGCTCPGSVEHMLIVDLPLADSDAVEYDCPRCAWSDHQKYIEHSINAWAPGEPTTHEVMSLNMTHKYIIKSHFSLGKLLLKINYYFIVLF